MGRVVRKSEVVAVIGPDHHNGLYYLNVWTGMAPWAPPFIPMPIPAGLTPVPISIHFTVANANWLSMEDKSNPTVIAEGAPVVSKNHAAQRTAHLPPGGNILIPMVIAFSSSTWKLAAGTVLAAQGALATTIGGGSMGLNVNCGDPTSLPTGVFRSSSSVHVDAKDGDWLVFAIDFGVVAAIELALSAGLSFAADGIKKAVLKRFIKAPAELVASGAAKEVVEAAAQDAVEKAVPIYQLPDAAGDIITDQLTGEASDALDKATRKYE